MNYDYGSGFHLKSWFFIEINGYFKFSSYNEQSTLLLLIHLVLFVLFLFCVSHLRYLLFFFVMKYKNTTLIRMSFCRDNAIWFNKTVKTFLAKGIFRLCVFVNLFIHLFCETFNGTVAEPEPELILTRVELYVYRIGFISLAFSYKSPLNSYLVCVIRCAQAHSGLLNLAKLWTKSYLFSFTNTSHRN